MKAIGRERGGGQADLCVDEDKGPGAWPGGRVCREPLWLWGVGMRVSVYWWLVNESQAKTRQASAGPF
jgi:hypothetical protein